MTLLPEITATQTHSYDREENDKPFDDLVHIGGWPAKQSIKRITSIVVHFDSSRVNGIEISYELSSGMGILTKHGRSTGESARVDFEEGTLLVSAFGSSISQIGFMTFNTRGGAIQIYGPFGWKPRPGEPPSYVIPYGTFGNIIAFNGTENDKGELKGIGFYKTDPQVPAYV
ncbi:hypothetical protein B0F90DRAFT_300033 [Multifurca ochricompacta]|uniref:Jacalin-type lectin domain-containing protein n=1 Tax=Multifurca ochricompacta TaxID=376703 RepID=A0AAD4LVT5_9AGAM|nr:hypothetical protein B0F90DRAFT_300033 [Multifurca ochricompacta]